MSHHQSICKQTCNPHVPLIVINIKKDESDIIANQTKHLPRKFNFTTKKAFKYLKLFSTIKQTIIIKDQTRI